MIWVLLQSESPWQRNNAITFLFIFLFLCTRSFFFKKSLKGVYVHAIIASYSRLPITRTKWGNRKTEV